VEAGTLTDLVEVVRACARAELVERLERDERVRLGA